MADFIWYCLFDYWEDKGDPRTRDFPLVAGSPLPVMAIIAAYVFFVKVAGPSWLMAKREPFELRTALVLYNIYNVLISVWFFGESIYCLDYGRKLFDFAFPSPEDRSPKTLHCCRMLYIYMLSKFADMADTVFFVLRKKNNQISTLHTYHHSVTPFLIWMAVKLMPCAGPAGLFPLCNSFIHAIMYSYYALSALGPTYRRLLFWKKYITLLQLAQFVVYIIHATLFLFLQSGYPKFIVYVAYVQNPFFFIMFYQFFHTTYGTIKQSSGTLISKPQLKTS